MKLHHLPPLFTASSRGGAHLLRATCAAVLLALSACASGPGGAGSAKGDAERGAPEAASASTDTAGANAARPGAKPEGQDIATRHALFKVSAFDTLPGWQQDNMGEAWAAFKESCRALERKPNWKNLCIQVKGIKDPKAGRLFLEREFTLLTVQNTDKTRDGDITGYYEPLLQGRAQRDAQFSVPVYGVPNDLYFLDWKTLPAAQRKGVATVRANGRLLSPAQAGQPGVIAVDMRRFTLDTLDRRLRVRLQGNEGLPYYSRADINRQAASLDAPVLAWVDDPIALYAMQVQGTGRIRMPDGTVLRMAYADQNGHPFKPMQLAASGNERVQTRGVAGKGDGGDALDEVEHFDLADSADSSESAAPDAVADEPLTRGGIRKPAPSLSAPAPADPGVSATVDSLLPPSGGAAKSAVKTPASSAGLAPAPGKSVSATSLPAVPAAKPSAGTQPGSQQVVDDLLTQTGRTSQQKSPRVAASTSMPTIAAAAKPGAAGGLANTLVKQRSAALDSDPSYVFFRIAPDQSTQTGPVGALGVPLTAGRSLAVDPRVMPLGYPVFLDAAGGDKRQAQMRRLMFAQDTGGAIRGAVRADYFWGFGADAGKQARRTKNRGRMWVLVPHAEVEALLSSKLVTRGRGLGTPQRDCLIDDEAFCDEAVAEEVN